MVNPVSVAMTAADLRGRFGVGVFSQSGAGTVNPRGTGASAHRGAYWAGCVRGKLRFPASHDMALGQHNPSKQHDAFTTRIAAARGGGLGSLPAREPEPV
jgi:hypothetical protein